MELRDPWLEHYGERRGTARRIRRLPIALALASLLALAIAALLFAAAGGHGGRRAGWTRSATAPTAAVEALRGVGGSTWRHPGHATAARGALLPRGRAGWRCDGRRGRGRRGVREGQ
jgi:hypothetical protein